MFLWKTNSQSLADEKICFHNHSANGESKISLTEMHDVGLRLLHAKIVMTTSKHSTANCRKRNQFDIYPPDAQTSKLLQDGADVALEIKWRTGGMEK